MIFHDFSKNLEITKIIFAKILKILKMTGPRDP